MAAPSFYDALAPASWPLFALLTARIAGLFFTAPIFSSRGFPVSVRSAVTLVLALLLLPGMRPLAGVTSSVELLGLVAIELFLGAVIGYTANILFHGILMGGEVAGIQMGLMAANLVDPLSDTSVPVVATFLNLLATTIFFICGGPMILLHALASTLAYFPPGAPVDFSHGLPALVLTLGQVFTIALRVVAPVVVSVFLANVVLGVMARVAPTMNVFVNALPLTIAFGLLTLSLMLPAFGGFVIRWTEHLPAFIEQVLGLFQPR